MGGGVGGGTAVITVCKQKVDDDEFAAAASDPDKNPDLIPATKIKSTAILCRTNINMCINWVFYEYEHNVI